MLKLYTGLQTWWADLKDRTTEEHGATAVEYALMVALIAVVIIAAVTFEHLMAAALDEAAELFVVGSHREQPPMRV